MNAIPIFANKNFHSATVHGNIGSLLDSHDCGSCRTANSVSQQSINAANCLHIICYRTVAGKLIRECSQEPMTKAFKNLLFFITKHFPTKQICLPRNSISLRNDRKNVKANLFVRVLIEMDENKIL